ncbi:MULTISPECIES: hypothetical protein [Flammeovirga]|uniref:Uncharacterized protein n=1 Tax=Flammeovirga agarivorans TaxID=2726742 RepID=A0A7X8XXY8_9BACT|nr:MULTISPECIES: hypothetical protein [Flammeovirga]NLR93588.1 hypothetical protein [Flammeovirga agarivorans]
MEQLNNFTEIEQRVYLEFKKEEIGKIRQQMKKKTSSVWLKSMKVASVAATTLLLLGSVYVTLLISPQSVVNDSIDKYNLSDRSYTLTEERLPLQVGVKALHEQKFHDAEMILMTAKESDHKDFFLCMAEIGAGNYEDAKVLMEKMEKDPAHLYHREITNSLKLKVFMLELLP